MFFYLCIHIKLVDGFFLSKHVTCCKTKIFSISVITQLDAHIFCFTISLFHSSTCFEHMCSKHVEAWNKLIVKQKFCASSWLITEINILRCTVSKTSKIYIFLIESCVCVCVFVCGGVFIKFMSVKITGYHLPNPCKLFHLKALLVQPYS